jgi:hypothetical protein
MAELPSDDDDDAPNLSESAFLIRLWTRLDAASELSVRADVLEYLDQIAEHCQAAIDEIARWRQRQRP